MGSYGQYHDFLHGGFPWVPVDFKADLFYVHTNNYCDVKSIIIMYDVTKSIRTTPRGAQDKQPLALTWCELPWAPADYKTRHNTIKPSVSSAFSKETHRRL